MPLKSFSQFINEDMNQSNMFIKKLAQSLIDKLRTSSFTESETYSIFSGMEFTEPFTFDLILNARRDSNPILNGDSHFDNLPWERVNFDRLGYCIDANTKMSKSKIKIPSITLHIILDPKREPILYSKLYHRLIDILTHETNHLDQLGINRDPFNSHVSDNQERAQAKHTYKYFLLGEEIESMIEGMYARSQSQNIPLDQAFDEYLKPFIETGYINTAEYCHVMEVWVTRSLELYPDASFSHKVDHIVNSI
jgi:hypothetical protein